MGRFKYVTISAHEMGGYTVTVSDAETPEAHENAILQQELGNYTDETVIHINGFRTEREVNNFCSERDYIEV